MRMVSATETRRISGKMQERKTHLNMINYSGKLVVCGPVVLGFESG